jgi:hypothetical protein
MNRWEPLVGLGLLTLAGLVVLWLIWPYVVGFLAVVGAVQVMRVIKGHSNRRR